MKKLTIILLIMLICPAWGSASEQGQSIFKSQGCAACHRAESNSKVNPSLTDIARAYSGKTDQLIRYMNGEAEPIVKPDKSSMMKRFIKRTRALSDDERRALADFIMSHK